MKEKKKILLTIIITNFNKEKYLNECLKSITKQKLEKIEIILIDDNSNDRSKKILKKYKKKIQIIYNKKNLGPSICRNIGIKKANGLYLAFIDADDKIYHKLSTITNNITSQKNENQLIILKYVSTNNKLNNDSLFLNKKKIIQEYSTDFFLKKKIKVFLQHEPVWYILFLKSHLKKNKIAFLEKSNCLEDLDFVIRSISLSKYVGLLNLKYYYYRELKESLKKDFSIKRTLGVLNVYKSLQNFLKKNRLSFIKKKLLTLRILFAKNIFFMRYYLLNKKKNLIDKKSFKSHTDMLKKLIIKKFLIKQNDKIAIYCYGPSGKFLYKILKESNLKDIIFIDDKIDFLNKISKFHKIYNFDNNLLRSYKIIIANPKKYIVSNIKKKNPKLRMSNFNINELLVKNTKNLLK